MTTSMSRPPQPPAKQFILRQRSSDAELLRLYRERDQCYEEGVLLAKKVDDFLAESRKESERLLKVERWLDGQIAEAARMVQIPVIAVMNPAKNEKTLFYPDDTAFKNPIETVPMKPEDYELPLL